MIWPFWRWYRALETELHPLRYLFWETTLRCDFSCLHCGSDCRPQSPFEELDTESIRRVFVDLSRRMQARSIHVVLTGGEPLLRADLFDVLETLHLCGFGWGLVTNGWHLDPEKACRLRSLGCEAAAVSLDGPPTAHDRLRGRNGSFERAVRAIEMLSATGVPTVEAVMVVHHENLAHIASLARIVASIPATHLRFVPLFAQGRARRAPQLALADDDWRTLVAEVAALRRHAPRHLEINLGDEGYLPPVVDRAVRKDRYFCRAGINVASILADGAVAACPNLPRSLVQGHVRDGSLVDIWNTRYEVFRDRSWMRQGRCGACREWKNCQGNALHLYDWEKSSPGRCHFAVMQGS